MFEVSSEEFVDLKKANLVFLHQSLNQPQISPGAGLSPQQAECTMMVVQNIHRQMNIYVGLFFPQSSKRVLYKMGPFAPELLESQMQETEVFTSQMGFLMTNKHYATSSEVEKKEMLRVSPFFYKDLEHYFQSLSQSEIEVKRGQVEVTAKRDAEADQNQQFLQQYVTILGML